MCVDSHADRPRDDLDHSREVAAYLAGDQAAGERLFALVGHHARVTARDFLRRDDGVIEDIAQDAAISVLRFMRQGNGFEGDLVNFTLVVARNRCRNYLEWAKRREGPDVEPLADYLADPGDGPLDRLLADERDNLVRRALASLDAGCRDLLTDFYRNRRRAEDIRRSLGLKTVAGVYHRRAVCLNRAGRLLNSLLLDCSSDGPAAGARRDVAPDDRRGNEEAR